MTAPDPAERIARIEGLSLNTDDVTVSVEAHDLDWLCAQARRARELEEQVNLLGLSREQRTAGLREQIEAEQAEAAALRARVEELERERDKATAGHIVSGYDRANLVEENAALRARVKELKKMRAGDLGC